MVNQADGACNVPPEDQPQDLDQLETRREIEYVRDNLVWWRASFIDGPTLKVLLQNHKPYQFHFKGDGYAIYANVTRDDWDKNIMRLRKSAGLVCTQDMIAATFPN